MISLKRVIGDTVVNTVIVLNSVVIFLLLFPEIPEGFQNILFGIDSLFNFYFLVEIVCKINLYGSRYYTKFNNIIDILLLCIIIVSLTTGGYHNVYGLYSLRLIRVIKCIKLFKIIPNYDRLIKAVSLAWKTCSGLFIGILIVLFVMSIILTMIYGNTEHFSNPLTSLYNVFRLFSIEGWYDIPNEVSKNSSIIASFFTKTIFSLIVFFGGMVGMSFLTSVVTDELAADNNDEVIHRLDKMEKMIEDIYNRTNKINNG